MASQAFTASMRVGQKSETDSITSVDSDTVKACVEQRSESDTDPTTLTESATSTDSDAVKASQEQSERAPIRRSVFDKYPVFKSLLGSLLGSLLFLSIGLATEIIVQIVVPGMESPDKDEMFNIPVLVVMGLMLIAFVIYATLLHRQFNTTQLICNWFALLVIIVLALAVAAVTTLLNSVVIDIPKDREEFSSLDLTRMAVSIVTIFFCFILIISSFFINGPNWNVIFLFCAFCACSADFVYFTWDIFQSTSSTLMVTTFIFVSVLFIFSITVFVCTKCCRKRTETNPSETTSLITTENGAFSLA